jgi:NitT/TauT family transport system substrate-binding protein
MDGLPGIEHRRRGRRRFLAGASSLGACSLLAHPLRASAEPPPETTRLRIFEGPVTCIAPQLIAQELLHAEGFTDVRYVNYPRDSQLWPPEDLVSGEVDISLSFVPSDLTHIDAGAPVVVLAGSHNGCVEVVGNARVRSTLELKGKNVGIQRLHSDEHYFVSMFAAYVGLNPAKDINWVISPAAHRVRDFEDGKIDAFMSGPPHSQELRDKKIGQVLVNITTDRPWSHYVCCLIASSKEFVGKHPVATKRALRAILKGADVCAREPERVARLIADRGLARYDYALQGLTELPYARWRDYDPEDAMRFYSLRMRDVGMLKSSPQRIISQGADWRFLRELKRELKA